MWVQSLGREDPLKKATATHSSILAWEISWTGGLQSMGSQESDMTWWSNHHPKIRLVFTFLNVFGEEAKEEWYVMICANYMKYTGGPVVKNPPANAGDTRDMGSIPGSGRSPEEGNGNPPQHSCLKNPMNRGAWQAIVYEVAKSQTWLNDWAPPNKVLLKHHSLAYSCSNLLS